MFNLFKEFLNKLSKSLKAKITSGCFIFLYIIVILSSTIKLNLVISTPGVFSNPQEFITINGDVYDFGNINTIGVYVTYRPTIFQYLISQNKDFEIDEYNPTSDLSVTDQVKRSTLLKDISIDYAIIASYKKAAINDRINIDYKYSGLLVTANLPISYSNKLQIGDLIIGVSVNGIYNDLLNYEGDEYINHLVSLISGCYSTNKLFTFKVMRNNEIVEIEFKWSSDKTLGLELKPKFEILDTTYPNFTIDLNKVHSSIGSSGGMMLTLSLYNSLIEEDVTKGLFICGTGTIDENGNVGAIGSIQQKIVTAQLYKADIFFCPYSSDKSSSAYQNYIDALEKYNEIKKPTFKLIPVTSFDDVLDALKNYRNKDNGE